MAGNISALTAASVERKLSRVARVASSPSKRRRVVAVHMLSVSRGQCEDVHWYCSEVRVRFKYSRQKFNWPSVFKLSPWLSSPRGARFFPSSTFTCSFCCVIHGTATESFPVMAMELSPERSWRNMGLDMYGYAKKGEEESHVEPRLLAEAHRGFTAGWSDLWREKGGEGVFNCIALQLTAEDLGPPRKETKERQLEPDRRLLLRLNELYPVRIGYRPRQQDLAFIEKQLASTSRRAIRCSPAPLGENEDSRPHHSGLSPDLPHDPHRQLQVPLGVDLGDLGVGVAQHRLGRLQPVRLTDHRGPRVTQLPGRPGRDAGPEAGPLDRRAIAVPGISPPRGQLQLPGLAPFVPVDRGLPPPRLWTVPPIDSSIATAVLRSGSWSCAEALLLRPAL